MLDKIRNSRDLGSDEALARDLKLTVRTISNIRSGKQPSLATLLLILDAADIELKAAIEVVNRPAA
ncbi:helix-turn-helix domain-containing protein [Prescottella equi]